MSAGGSDIYNFFCTDENQTAFGFRNLLLLVFVSCMNIWLWKQYLNDMGQKEQFKQR